MIPADVIVSTGGVIVAALAGVAAGAVLTSRSQARQWFRDEQVRACADVLRESTKIILEYEVASRKSRKQQVNWIPWNEALAVISIVGDQRIVRAAVRIDASFWPASSKIDSLSVTDDEWFTLRDHIEALRLDFINTSRKVLGRSGAPLQHILGRPANWIWPGTQSAPSPVPSSDNSKPSTQP
jgi:hypothetical protein